VSKYETLWNYIKEQNDETFTMSFEEIENVAGLPIDHSFLTYKKELTEYGYEVAKISLKNKTVQFLKARKK